MTNPILKTDSYKFSHFAQYPRGAEYVSSYIEARGSQIPGVDEVVFFGLQAFINDVLMTPVTQDHLNEAIEFCNAHGVPLNAEGWQIIIDDHDGYLPIEIRAVPEGTPVPLGQLMASVVNLDPRLPWVTSYVETLLLSYVWYGSTVATLSREMKKVIKKYLDQTSDNADAVLPFKLHDFGYRGVAAGAAGLGGAAHLINFSGTDTVAGIEFAQKHYGAGMVGFSIPASEHSTMTSWGQDSEFEAYRNMVDAYAKPGAIFACVIDSYDTFEAIDMWLDQDKLVGGSLLDIVKSRGATVVLRPDSGDPVEMPVDVVMYLLEKVGYTVNKKGYKVLPDHVRVIQGDGIDINDIKEILAILEENDISAENITFGMGGGLLQKVNRDTFKFAMKASAIQINDVWRDVQKNPSSDRSKKSKAGNLTLLRKGDVFKTVRVEEVLSHLENNWSYALDQVYHKRPMTSYTFDEVRKNAEIK